MTDNNSINTSKREVLYALGIALKPLVQSMIQLRISYPELVDLLAFLYVIADKQGSNKQYAITTYNTGIKRRQQMKWDDCLTDADPLQAAVVALTEPDDLQKLIDGWSSDPEFSDNDGPRALTCKGRECELMQLVKRYASMPTYGPYLNALVEGGYAARDRNGLLVLKNSEVVLPKYHTKFNESLVNGVRHMLTALQTNLAQDADLRPVKIVHGSVDPSHINRLRALIEAEFDQSGEAISKAIRRFNDEQDGGKTGRGVGAGFYLVETDD